MSMLDNKNISKTMCRAAMRGQKRLRDFSRDGVRKFTHDEDGGLIIFGLFMFILMLMIGGMAVDLMRFEATRTKLQGTVDRAVLAAADLDQTLPAAEVVADYFDKAGMTAFLVSTEVDESITHREVNATAHVSLPMYFMKMMGIMTLEAPASGTAAERVAKVEISLILDISGSMDDNNKLENMQAAAVNFVNTVLSDGNADRVTISLVPYSEHVNAGPLLYDQMNKYHQHDFSHCIEFPNSHFQSAALNTGYTYTQMQHYQWNYPGWNQMTDTVCPRYTYEQITPWSQNAGALTAQINALQPRAGTSIFLGMKWGTALLDPSTQGMLTTLIGSNDVDAAFAGRPAAYKDDVNDSDTLKTIVLMTDGQNDRSNRIKSWAYDSSSDYANWANYNFIYYLYRYVYSSQWGNYYYQKYSAGHGDNLLDDICDEAKDAGIIVWTIGFETTTHGNGEMANCASSPSHFFEVDGGEIEDAFTAIAQQINHLRLLN